MSSPLTPDPRAEIGSPEHPATDEPSPLQPRGGPYLSITGAASYAAVSPDTIRRAIQQGRLRATRPARLWRILRADLDAFMEGGVR